MLRMRHNKDFVSVDGPIGDYQLDFSASSILLYILLSPYICFIFSLYLDLYLLGDDTPISQGSFMRTKHLFDLIHMRNKGEVGTIKIF